MIQQCLGNALRSHGINRHVISVITQVIVDKKDPSLSNPTKPIGPFYSEKEAMHMLQNGYQLIHQPQGWRIVVPSPDPQGIVESKIINTLLDDNIIVIASGGGGLPVIEKEKWGLDGLEAVVDKDLASEQLAEAVKAQRFIILTDVEHVYLNYNTPDQTPLNKITLDEIKKYYKQDIFPSGSMRPKIQAAIRFLEQGGETVIISHIEKGWKAFQGKTGTIITKQ